MHTRAAAILLSLLAPAAAADIAATNAVQWANTETALEARVRLDAGDSQTWKSAFWQGDTLLSTSGNAQNVFTDGASTPFNFAYDADSSLATLDVAGRSLSNHITPPAGKQLAGLQLALRSEHSVGTTLLFNVQATIDGAPSPFALPDMNTNLTSDTSVVGPALFFDSAANSLSLTGDITFDWGSGDTSGDHFKLSLYVIMGNALPSAPTTAMLAPIALAIARRRR
jgi:hypothetical protein